MIRIAISEAAFDAIARTMLLGSGLREREQREWRALHLARAEGGRPSLRAG